MKEKIAIFDFDGTLTVTDSTKFLLLSLIIYKPFFIKKFLFFLKRKTNSGDAFQFQKNELIGALIKNYTTELLQKRLWLFNFLIKLTFRKEIMLKLYSYQKQNYSIVIATASPAFAIRNLFPTDIDIIGTEFLQEQNLFNGRLSGNNCFGENKAIAVKDYLRIRGVDHADIAFSDHESDMPLLMCAKESYIVTRKGLAGVEKDR